MVQRGSYFADLGTYHDLVLVSPTLRFGGHQQNLVGYNSTSEEAFKRFGRAQREEFVQLMAV